MFTYISTTIGLILIILPFAGISHASKETVITIFGIILILPFCIKIYRKFFGQSDKANNSNTDDEGSRSDRGDKKEEVL